MNTAGTTEGAAASTHTTRNCPLRPRVGAPATPKQPRGRAPSADRHGSTRVRPRSCRSRNGALYGALGRPCTCISPQEAGHLSLDDQRTGNRAAEAARALKINYSPRHRSSALRRAHDATHVPGRRREGGRGRGRGPVGCHHGPRPFPRPGRPGPLRLAAHVPRRGAPQARTGSVHRRRSIPARSGAGTAMRSTPPWSTATTSCCCAARTSRHRPAPVRGSRGSATPPTRPPSRRPAPHPGPRTAPHRARRGRLPRPARPYRGGRPSLVRLPEPSPWPPRWQRLELAGTGGVVATPGSSADVRASTTVGAGTPEMGTELLGVAVSPRDRPGRVGLRAKRQAGPPSPQSLSCGG